MSDKFVKKSEKVAFYGVPGEGEEVTYHRMRGFDKIEKSDNPQEYSRTYMDEDYERTDVTGYNPEYSCSFDQMTGSAVHDDILSIVDEEVIGSAAVRSILIVDLSKEAADKPGAFNARVRNMAIIGDGETRDNFYNRSVNLKPNGTFTKGTATSTDGWLTAVFAADEE